MRKPVILYSGVLFSFFLAACAAPGQTQTSSCDPCSNPISPNAPSCSAPCTSHPLATAPACNPCAGTSVNQTAVVVVPKTIKVSAVGFGAPPMLEGLPPVQRRLMAMRASKLDAYRSLAEQIHGVKLVGNTTVSMLAAQNDSFRAYVDATIRGARVLSMNPLPDGAFETVLEIELPQDIYNQYLRLTGTSPQNGISVASNSPVDVYVTKAAEIRSADYYLAR